MAAKWGPRALYYISSRTKCSLFGHRLGFRMSVMKRHCEAHRTNLIVCQGGRCACLSRV
jgi:hypothetical protein